MQGIADFPAFVAAALVVLMIPGPGTPDVLAAAARGGVRGGYAALAGLMLGDWLLMAAAMVGVAALLAAHPLLFKALQYLGVAYLLWVGLRLLIGRANGGSVAPRGDVHRHFRLGLLITVTNPKAVVFYMAFLPLFIDPARYQGLSTFAAMAATLAALTLLYGTVLIGAGHWAARRLGAESPVGRWLSRAAGVARLGFGVRLATD